MASKSQSPTVEDIHKPARAQQSAAPWPKAKQETTAKLIRPATLLSVATTTKQGLCRP
jgi:hypothetical protein